MDFIAQKQAAEPIRFIALKLARSSKRKKWSARYFVYNRSIQKMFYAKSEGKKPSFFLDVNTKIELDIMDSFESKKHVLHIVDENLEHLYLSFKSEESAFKVYTAMQDAVETMKNASDTPQIYQDYQDDPETVLSKLLDDGLISEDEFKALMELNTENLDEEEEAEGE